MIEIYNSYRYRYEVAITAKAKLWQVTATGLLSWLALFLFHSKCRYTSRL